MYDGRPPSAESADFNSPAWPVKTIDGKCVFCDFYAVDSSPEGNTVVANTANIYVGNLPFTCTENELRTAFEAFGQVSGVNLIQDRETGRPRGFAFVEMSDPTAAKQAIEKLNLSPMGGRNITVNEAKPREPRSGGAGRGGQRRQW